MRRALDYRPRAPSTASASTTPDSRLRGQFSGRDGGFSARHPELTTGKGTIQVRPDDAAGIPDDEFRNLVSAALDG
jgi:hypothetical protein